MKTQNMKALEKHWADQAKKKAKPQVQKVAKTKSRDAVPAISSPSNGPTAKS